jgi:predicted CopG family antitoxin
VSTKTIAVDSEAYALLSRAKKHGETFSDVVKRSLKPKRPLMDFAGLWKDLDKKELAEIRRSIEAGRRLDRAREKRLLERWNRR